MADIEALEYSTLDLCAPDAFTLILGSSGCRIEQDSMCHLRKSARVAVNTYVAGRDFLFTAPPSADWANVLARGCGLLVRPDQHILAIFEGDVSEALVEQKALEFLRLPI